MELAVIFIVLCVGFDVNMANVKIEPDKAREVGKMNLQNVVSFLQKYVKINTNNC